MACRLRASFHSGPSAPCRRGPVSFTLEHMLRLSCLAATLISLALYAWSLLLPAFVCTSRGFMGYEVLVYGWLGLIYFDPRWFANVLYFWIVINVFLRSRTTPLWVPIAAEILALVSIPFASAGCESVGGAAVFSRHLAIGGYVWFASVSTSVAVWFIAYVFCKHTRTRLNEF